MPVKLDNKELKLLRAYIEKHCGIALSDEKAYLIENRLAALMATQGCASFSEFYYKALADKSELLRDKIIDAMTTNETLWFRDASPFAIMRDKILPQVAAEIREGKRSALRIWCAACSSGQEPYSLAITIAEFRKKHPAPGPEQVEITATDISPTMLFIAKNGRYDDLQMSRGMPGELLSRYFKKDGSAWTIDVSIKKMVQFKKHNLQDARPVQSKHDIIFCRNVLIYFSDELKIKLLGSFAELLRPSGYLITGASESVGNYSREFRMLSHADGLYYQVHSDHTENNEKLKHHF